MKIVKNKTDLLNVFFDILITDMPFRNFTLRFYTRMLLELEPNFRLSAAQKHNLMLAFVESCQTLRKVQNQVLSSARLRNNPELLFYDSLME